MAFLFGLLALAAVAPLSYQLGQMLSAQMLRERGDALRGIADGVALLLGEGLNERLREVSLLAQSSQALRIGLDAAAWSAEIERLRPGRPHYAWIGVTNAAGAVVSATDGVLVGRDVSQRPWFLEGRTGAFLGDVHAAKLLASLLPAPGDGEPLRFIDFSAPLRDAGDAAIGVIGVHADWRWARDVIARLRWEDARDAGVLVFILDRSGKAIHQPLGVAAAEPASGQTASAAPALLPWTDGRRYLTLGAPLPRYAGLPDLGWTIVVRQPDDLALRGVGEAQRQVWGWGLFAGLSSMLLAWVVAGRLSKPLEQISVAAERIENGERQVVMPMSNRTRELQRLSQALAGMTGHLVTREVELQQANELLEARVDARTRDLEASNAELARVNGDLERLAHRDGLTGLHNRRSADLMLQREMARHRRYGRPLGVLLCDIDHFKKINDTCGHAFGDDVLKAVAGCLHAAVRESDATARFGGEEFLVILPETDAAGVARVAEKIRRAVAALDLADETVAAGPPARRLTISLGGAVAEAGRGGVSLLLRRADEALYTAKDDGRNRVLLAEPAESPFAETVV